MIFAVLGGEKTKPIQSQYAGEAEPAQTIPKAFGFEAATQGKVEKTKPIFKSRNWRKYLYERVL